MKRCLPVFLLIALLLSFSVFLTSCENPYSVNFETNGGPKLDAKKVTDTVTEIPTPEREDYRFDGWFFDSSFTAPVTVPFSINSDVTVYAKWTKLHSIDFVSNGGTNVDTQKVTESVASPSAPKRDGYVFDGWYFDTELTIPISFPLLVNCDVTLYAKWLKLYSVNFISNGGPDVETVQVTSVLENAPSLKRSGYVFDGWFSDPSLTAPVSFPYTVNSNITLYAKWLKQHTVTFATNGGSEINSQKTTDTIANPPSPKRSGYIFEGWYLDSALTAPAAFPLSVNKDITLYAKWQKEYIVVFNSNGGSSISTQKTTSTIANPPSPQRTGYVFEGWYLDSALTAPATFPMTVNKDMTLYAKWRELYTIYFDTNGGSYITPQTLQNAILSKPPVEPTKTDFLFDGWYLDASLTTPVTFPLSVNRDTKLYAKWLKLTDEIHYQGCFIKNDAAIYTITPKGFDLEKLNLMGYYMKITVTYKVRYVKDYDVLWDIGYAGSPKYEIYLRDGSGVGQIAEDMSTTTYQKTRTMTLIRSAADLINDKITLKVSTNNIQNIIYFEDIIVTYECY